MQTVITRVKIVPMEMGKGSDIVLPEPQYIDYGEFRFAAQLQSTHLFHDELIAVWGLGHVLKPLAPMPHTCEVNTTNCFRCGKLLIEPV